MLQSAYAAEVVKLRERVEYLEAELHRRDTEFQSDVTILMRNAGVSVGMARILVALSRGATLSRDSLAAICDYSDDLEVFSIDSQIKRLRRRLPWLTISNHYGAGWSVSGDSLKTLRRLIKGS